MENLELPKTLVEAVRSGRVVLFLGAGASLQAKDADRKSAPSTKALSEELCQKFLGEKKSDVDLQLAAELAAQAATNKVVFEYIKDRLSGLQPTRAHSLIPTFRWHTIATTNYDTLIEDSYGKSVNAAQDLVRFVKDSEPIETRMMDAHDPVQLLKLHGCIDHAHDVEIPLVLDAPHYERYRQNRKKLFTRLEGIADELPFLFVGYSLNDPHIANIIHNLENSGTRPEYFVVSPGITPEVKKLWATRRITTIDGTFDQFMRSLDADVPPMWRQLKAGELAPDLPIRSHFRVHGDPSENLIAALDRDIEHVHATMPLPTQSADKFYKGYDNGLRAISLGLDVPRKVTDDVIYASAEEPSEDKAQRLHLLAGAGGSGKTVILKRAIWELSVALDLLCVWQRGSSPLRADTFRELYDLTGKHILLGVDNLSTKLDELAIMFRELYQNKVPITVIGTERLSTWNIVGSDFEERWPVELFKVGQLLPIEVEGLLDKLSENHALGALQSLSREEQMAEFARADRHLLVALHELTSGEPFEKIVLEEFKSLAPERAQSLYLDVCTLNQFDVPARAGAIKRLTAIPYSMFERDFFGPLEAVVLTHSNRYTGDFEYSARHPRVAQLVFSHVLTEDSERVAQLSRFLDLLDVGYSSDRDALFQVVRARNLLSLVRDLTLGRQFYDQATDTLAEHGFVWQHRAIYEMRHHSGDLNLAEEYAQKAAQLEPRNKSFGHTLAEVAREQARRADNPAKKTLHRRQSYERLAAISGGKNSYADYTRCKLKLDELREAAAEIDGGDEVLVTEFAALAKDAQEAIDTATSKYPQDADIARLEADFLGILNDKQGTKIALERAWRLGAAGSGIAIQLSKIYEKAEDLEKAVEVVSQALEQSPDDKSANYRMANLLVAGGTDQERAMFYAARSYGMADRSHAGRYLHAKLLFLNGDGETSSSVFADVDKLAPTGFMPRTQIEKIGVSSLVGRLNGRIVSLNDSYLFAEHSDYPKDIFIHSADCSNVDWNSLRKNAPVAFSVGFNRLGPAGFDLALR